MIIIAKMPAPTKAMMARREYRESSELLCDFAVGVTELSLLVIDGHPHLALR
jgi:hypothetical protein